MKLITLNNIGLSIGTEELFGGLSFSINVGSKIGLIGYNGCGKSTLFKVIDGTYKASSGSIAISRNILLARVEQDLQEDLLNSTLRDVIIDKLKEEDRDYNTWKVDVLLEELGLSYEDGLKKVAELSGGQYNKALIARALIQNPDFLLLDEPSNHMDLTTILWLEVFLKNYKGGFVLISHDRKLLDNTTSESLILRDKKVYHFKSSYSTAWFEINKMTDDSIEALKNENTEIKRVEVSAKRLAIWGKNYNNAKFASKAKSMQKKVEKLKDNRTFVSMDKPNDIIIIGEKLIAKEAIIIPKLEIKNISEDSILYTIDSERIIKPTDKIALVGKNGSGKSTLLYWLYKNYKTNNTNYTYHNSLKLEYYDQNNKIFTVNEKINANLSYLSKSTDDIVKQSLIQAGFNYNSHTRLISDLSGGQKARLHMLLLSLKNPNFIMFDEPTNHLDIHGKQSLVDTLKYYQGGYIMVSHDRYFLEQTCSRFLYIHDGKIMEENSISKVYDKLKYGIDNYKN